MPAQHNLMRKNNGLSILNHIRANGASTRREIQRATGLSWSTVSIIVSELINQEILVEKIVEERVAGRNPNLLDFNPRKNLSIGAEINIEGLTVVLVDLRGNVLDSQVEYLERAERNAVLDQLTRMIEELLRGNGLDRDRMLGIGISVQGSVDRDGAVSLYNRYIDGWTNVPLKALFEDYFGIPVRVMHDPVSVAFAEQRQSAFLEQEDFVLIRLAYGIGMSYMHKGAPVRGHEGTAGELGQMIINCTGDVANTLENYCSICGIAKKIYEAVVTPEERKRKHFREDDIVFLKELLMDAAQMANEGNLVIRKIFDDAGRYLGMAIANVINLLNPKYVILMGTVLDVSDLIVEQTRRCVQSNTWEISTYELIFSQESRLHAAIGASLQFVNDAFNDVGSQLLSGTQSSH